MTEPFETEIDIAAPPDVVFRHLTEPGALVRWIGQYAVLEPEPGGRFEVDINGVPIRGSYLEVEAPHRVLVTWGVAGSDDLPAGSTEVEFRLDATDTGTRLRLVHRKLPPTEQPQHETGWTHFLARLAIAASGGDPGPDPWATTA